MVIRCCQPIVEIVIVAILAPILIAVTPGTGVLVQACPASIRDAGPGSISLTCKLEASHSLHLLILQRVISGIILCFAGRPGVRGQGVLSYPSPLSPIIDHRSSPIVNVNVVVITFMKNISPRRVTTCPIPSHCSTPHHHLITLKHTNAIIQ